jgi:small subunit ribosomal protein S4e
MESIPLMVIARDILHLADTSKEARNIISRGLLQIDGKVVKDYQRPVGFMDVISIPATGLLSRILMDKNGILIMADVDPKDSKWKLVKVTGKRIIGNGKIQISTHDGRVIITEDKSLKRGDSLKISLPDQKILDVYPMANGTSVFVTGGAHIGSITKIKEINVSRSYQENTVDCTDNFTTTVSNVFVIGKAQIMSGQGGA